MKRLLRRIAPGTESALGFDLLRYAAASTGSLAHQHLSRRLSQAGERQIRWVTHAGLGALLYRAVRDSIGGVPAAWRSRLLSADLTAQVRYGVMIDTATDIIDVCDDLGVPVTLLKGISISEQHYPLGHVRPMGDIDVLVPRQAYAAVESALLRFGYEHKPDHHIDQDSHHGIPLAHPHRQVWVELHTDLFRTSAELRRDTVFNPSQIAAQSVASTFHGRRVYRLSDELQLLYIASSWIKDLSNHKIHPSFIIPLLDAVYLLKGTGTRFDWEGMMSWLDNQLAAASLYLMLCYLSSQRLAAIADPILAGLLARQDIVGASERRIIHAIVHSHLVRGRPFSRLFSDWHATIAIETLLTPGSHAAKLLAVPWNIAFPRALPDRYAIQLQLRRIARMMRGREGDAG